MEERKTVYKTVRITNKFLSKPIFNYRKIDDEYRRKHNFKSK